MKILAFAFALAIASPAVAQTAPAAPADHSQHQGAQHEGMQHGQHRSGEGSGCCADRNRDGRMDCCEHMGQSGQRQPAAGAEPQAHQHH